MIAGDGSLIRTEDPVGARGASSGRVSRLVPTALGLALASLLAPTCVFAQNKPAPSSPPPAGGRATAW